MKKGDTLEQDQLLEKVKTQVEEFLTQTQSARAASERDRDYVDHKQWTQAEIEKLTGRQQAPIVVNRIKPKVEGLKGLVSIRLTDPKAYPRTQAHEKSSEAITDGLRYVTDNNDFQDCKMQVCDDFFVEGYGGALVDVQQMGDEIDIRIEEIPWDRIYFDPHSRKKDFSDARYMGLILWMDEDEVVEKFPDADIDALFASKSDNEEFRDRPSWVDGKNRRLRIAHHFYKHKGVWSMCMFTDGLFLIEPDASPYLDEFGDPSNPIELVSAYIDRDNNRYGEVRGFIDQQDEINHRRSKALHLLSQRQTAGRKGAVKDIAAMKRELAKANGHVEYDGAKGDFEVLPTGDMAKGQFELYQDAKAELDAVSFNAQMAGERQQGDLSGIAINRLQQAGMMELNGLFSALNGWEKRIYRQVWARIKQFWTAEKWVRITDDEKNLRWVGLNAQVTAQEFLEERINDEAQPLHIRQAAAAAYTQLMQTNDPVLQQIVDVKNNVVEMDVDIILDQSFDTVNIQQEQFEMLTKFAQGADIDIIELISLSQIRGKDELIEKIEKRRQEAAQSQSQVSPVDQSKIESEQKKIELQSKSLDIDAQRAETERYKAESDVQLRAADLHLQINGGKVSQKPQGAVKTDGTDEEEMGLGIEELRALLAAKEQQAQQDEIAASEQQQAMMMAQQNQQAAIIAEKQAEAQRQEMLTMAIVQAVNNLTEAVMTPTKAVRKNGKLIGAVKAEELSV